MTSKTTRIAVRTRLALSRPLRRAVTERKRRAKLAARMRELMQAQGGGR